MSTARSSRCVTTLVGSANLLRGVQMMRKTIFELEPELERLEVPSPIVVGDQDEPCLEPSLFMKHHIPHAGLVMLPMTGHTRPHVARVSTACSGRPSRAAGGT